MIESITKDRLRDRERSVVMVPECRLPGTGWQFGTSSRATKDPIPPINLIWKAIQVLGCEAEAFLRLRDYDASSIFGFDLIFAPNGIQGVIDFSVPCCFGPTVTVAKPPVCQPVCTPMNTDQAGLDIPNERFRPDLASVTYQ
ncbi:hypothetical protein OHA72_14935 [Dactylosporangium sp. NBC_01737]|uniref:hypothetical protein n=1 Tax=Dactylosporangium sp. NBC_01737 TaxID=2975959 RepID=UPI002E11E7CD|nr:hypothetical protein OHA72_14935 [Dactylosporangium sp. NBC_01737]